MAYIGPVSIQYIQKNDGHGYTERSAEHPVNFRIGALSGMVIEKEWFTELILRLPLAVGHFPT